MSGMLFTYAVAFWLAMLLLASFARGGLKRWIVMLMGIGTIFLMPLI